METQKLYEADSHLRRCQAAVLDCFPDGDGFRVVLDRTIFFPEGGGQLSDGGTIGGVEVTETHEKGGRILHFTREAIPPGAMVDCLLDWPRRLDHMQQHTGEHILSWAFWKLLGVHNVGFHMGADIVTIDLDREVTQEEARAAEELANEQVFQDLPVRCRTASPEEMEHLPLRKKTEKFSGDLRLVEVEGGDLCTCCGTHVKRTGEIGIIKITRLERSKGGSRVEFLCGGRALRDYQLKNQAIQEAGAALSVKEGDVPLGIRRLKGEIAGLGATLRERSRLLTEIYAKELLDGTPEKNGGRVIVTCQPDLDAKEAKMLLNLLVQAPRTAAVILYPVPGEKDGQPGRLCYLLGRAPDSTADCKYLCDALNGLYNGKGGGRGDFAQGSGKLEPSWQETATALYKVI
jgi:alanyl-tRNA synthetase